MAHDAKLRLRDGWPTMRQASRLSLIASVMIGVLLGCDQQTPTQSRPRPTLYTRSVSAAVDDPTMGSLSSLARHVSLALQSEAVRREVYDSMKSPEALGAGLNLQECNHSGVAQDLLRSGELAGGSSAAAFCAAIRGLNGLTLYMDPGRLDNWNPKFLPIVTAIANPGTKLPAHFLGYRSARFTIDLPGNGSLKGPILVVLPRKHPRAYGKTPPTVDFRAIPQSPDTSRGKQSLRGVR